MAAPLPQPQPSSAALPEEPCDAPARSIAELTDDDLALIVGGNSDPTDDPTPGPPKRPS